MPHTAPLPSLRTLLVGLGLVLAPQAGQAQAVYWTRAQVLEDFFSESKRVTYRAYTLDVETRRILTKRLGYAPPTTLTVYYGLTAGAVDGLAVIDQEMGQHKPITFAVLVDPRGVMKRLEIMVYREPKGDEVRQERFRAQFDGKTARDPLAQGQDVVAVSGATISSKAMARGARRALVMLDELVLRPGLESLSQTGKR